MTRLRPFWLALSIFFLLTLVSLPARSQESASEETTAKETTAKEKDAAGSEKAEEAVAVESEEATDSNNVRNQLMRLLERHPPQLGRVLKLDPTLLENDSYLAAYPDLAAFLKEHPQVKHNPAFYLESVGPSWDQPEPASVRMWRNLMEGMSIFAVMLTVIGVFTWLVRTLIDHRRWSRIARVQAEVHTKLMDRFSSNEELLAYIQTPGGRKFLESAPISVEAAPRTASAPVSRMLWSIQVGLVLMAGGGGLQFVAGTIDREVAGPMSAMGVLAVAIGLGFVLSALVSFFLSWKLGLWNPRSQARETMAE
jgi:hypothetical protein